AFAGASSRSGFALPDLASPVVTVSCAAAAGLFLGGSARLYPSGSARLALGSRLAISRFEMRVPEFELVKFGLLSLRSLGLISGFAVASLRAAFGASGGGLPLSLVFAARAA